MALGERRSGNRVAIMTGAVFVPVASRRGSAANFRPSDARPDEDDMPSFESNLLREEPRWSRPRRVAFTVGAAVLCWAVPIAAVYWLAS